jgi:hypothetical protein
MNMLFKNRMIKEIFKYSMKKGINVLKIASLTVRNILCYLPPLTLNFIAQSI